MSGTPRDPLPQGWLDWNDGAANAELQPPPLPPSREESALRQAERYIDRLRGCARRRGIERQATPLLDRLLRLFRGEKEPRRRYRARAG